jgi:immune inhibitor A
MLTFALVAALLAWLLPAAALAVPPSPALLARAAQNPALAARLASAARQAKANGIDVAAHARFVLPARSIGVPPALIEGAAPVSGIVRTLALVVDFTDRAHQTQASFFDDLLFKDVFGPSSLRGYYREASYGTPTSRGSLDIVTLDAPSSVGWVRLPQTLAYYVAGGSYGMGSYPNNAQKMVEDAVVAADPLVDFSQYDDNGDGFVDNLIVVHAGRGAEVTGSTTDMWSHKWQTSSAVAVDGVYVATYSTEAEYWNTPGDMTVGVTAHEVGHVLGLPDLYDSTYASAGIGDWSLMATGCWNGITSAGGDEPARPDAWSSARLGWLQPQTLTGAPSALSLPTVGSSRTAAYKLYPRGATSGSEYFLVENRQRTGTDSRLPGDGLLVWHVDETRSSNDDPSHKLVDLEEAGGTQYLDSGEFSRGRPEDPFPGSSGKRTFSDTTNPNAKTYAGDPSMLLVDQVSNSSDTMTANVGLEAAAPITTTGYTFAGTATSGWHTTDQVVTLTASGGDGTDRTIHYSTDGGATWTAALADSLDVTVASEGAHRFQYYASDSLATEATNDAGYVNIDKTTPSTSDDHLSASLVAPATFTLSASDTLSGVAKTEYSVDGASSYASGATIVLSDGSHTVLYRSTDNAGNVESPDKSFSVVVRVPQAPTTTTGYAFAGTATSGWHTTDQVVTLTASGGDGTDRTIHYSTDGGATWTAALAGSLDVTVASEGAHRFQYYASDSLATEATHDTGYVNIDKTAPVTTDNADGLWHGFAVTVTLKPTDGGSGVSATRYTVDGHGPSQGLSITAPAPADHRNDGTHTIAYWSVDKAGNTGAHKTCRVRIDTTPPVTTQTGADTAWHNADVHLQFGATDGASGVAATSYSTDDGATWQTASSLVVKAPADHTGDGAHAVSYRSTDAVGNIETPKICTVAIDTRRPLTRAPSAAKVRRGFWATLRYRVDDQKPCAGRATVTIKVTTLRGKMVKVLKLGQRPANRLLIYWFRCKLAKKTYKFRVFATDAAGNKQAVAGSNRLVVR